MHIDKRRFLIAIFCIMMFVFISEAAINNTNATLNDQSGNIITIYHDYIPMLFLLIFSIAVLYIENKIAGTLALCHLKFKEIPEESIPRWSAQDQIRFIGLTIVVILAVFVVIIPGKPLETNNLTAAVFGFFGTVVGYLAGSGKASAEPENNSPGNNPPGNKSPGNNPPGNT